MKTALGVSGMTGMRAGAALTSRPVGELDFALHDVGSGMSGLPAGNTPPSHFVRALASTRTTRPTLSETVREVLRILDTSFRLPAERKVSSRAVTRRAWATRRTGPLLRSAMPGRLWFHTRPGPRGRKIRLAALDVDGTGPRHIPPDREKRRWSGIKR
jgi:choloylglycine hydrolase